MNYFFENKNNIARLNIILQSWKKTKYKHRCSVKKIGTDCILFPYSVFDELGLIRINTKVPHYSYDYFKHSNENFLYGYVKSSFASEDINTKNNMLSGDVLLLKYGRSPSHLGIYFNREIWHCTKSSGVINVIFSSLELRITNILRPL